MAFYERRSFDAEKLLRNLAGGKLPSDKAVHEATRNYIFRDYTLNGHLYAHEDLRRISKYLQGTNPLKVPGT